mmetsp:Transcript_9768/g.16448  ORF Transcript_9768/g.16448 Transcript_9768/m.16448 type:complete len:314 (-) Transcript_9768:622-1563(-)
MGEPAVPFEQLLAVFPKQSSHALPECYRKLYEDESEIIDFYPKDVKLDINGARYAWMGVNLLPFIDRKRLVKAMRLADDFQGRLSPSERERNKLTGVLYIYMNVTKRAREIAPDYGIQKGQKIKNDLKAKSVGMISSLQSLKFSGDDSFKLTKQLLPWLYPIFQGGDNLKKNLKTIGDLEKYEKCESISLKQLESAPSEQVSKATVQDKSIQVIEIVDEQTTKKSQIVWLVKGYCSSSFKDTSKTEIMKSRLLEGAELPEREVDPNAIFNINRRPFQGEQAIKIVERVLNIDASQDPIYNFNRRQNRNGHMHH